MSLSNGGAVKDDPDKLVSPCLRLLELPLQLLCPRPECEPHLCGRPTVQLLREKAGIMTITLAFTKSEQR